MLAILQTEWSMFRAWWVTVTAAAVDVVSASVEWKFHFSDWECGVAAATVSNINIRILDAYGLQLVPAAHSLEYAMTHGKNAFVSIQLAHALSITFKAYSICSTLMCVPMHKRLSRWLLMSSPASLYLFCMAWRTVRARIFIHTWNQMKWRQCARESEWSE